MQRALRWTVWTERGEWCVMIGVSGEELQRNGDFKHAIPKYTEAIDQDPSYAPAYWRRGTAQWELGATQVN